MNDSMIPFVKITKKSFSSDANIGFDGVLDLNAGAGLKPNKRLNSIMKNLESNDFDNTLF